jgi:hypothetical protein
MVNFKIAAVIVGFSCLAVVACNKSSSKSAGPAQNNSAVGYWLPEEFKPAYDAAQSVTPEAACALVNKINSNGNRTSVVGSAAKVDEKGDGYSCRSGQDQSFACESVEYKLNFSSGDVAATTGPDKNCTTPKFSVSDDVMTFERTCNDKKTTVKAVRITEDGAKQYFKIAEACIADADKPAN